MAELEVKHTHQQVHHQSPAFSPPQWLLKNAKPVTR